MMAPVDRSYRALRTLERSDPEYGTLIELLYGPDVDAEEVYRDVFAKMSPDQSELHSPGSDPGRLKRRVALAGTVAGGALATRELAGEVPKLKNAIQAKEGVFVPVGQTLRGKSAWQGVKTVAGSPAARVGTGTIAIGADAAATDELRPKQTTQKALPGVEQAADAVTRMKAALLPTDHPAVQAFMDRMSGSGVQGAMQDQGSVQQGIDSARTARRMGDPAARRAQAGGSMEQMRQNSYQQQAPGVANRMQTPQFQGPGRTLENPQGTAGAPSGAPGAPGAPQDPNQGNLIAQHLGNAAGSLMNAATATTGAKVGTGVLAGGAGLYGVDRTVARRGQANQVDPNDPYAYYGKRHRPTPTVTWEGTFSKFDEDKHLAFGWASVTRVGGRPVVDHQGDWIADDDLEDAAYSYVLKSRKGGHMHRRDEYDEPIQVSDLVESMVFTPEKIAKMGLPDDTPCGWWVGTKIHDPEVWQEVKKGNLAGFSIHGKGRRMEKSYDEVMYA